MAEAAGTSLKKGLALHRAYWKKNWAIKEVAKRQKYKIINDQMWLFNPVSKFWYSLRYEKDIFSTLVQGTASYVFDKWIENILELREQLTATFHDEGVWSLRQGHREEFTAMIMNSMKKLNEDIKLNRELGCEAQFGNRYSEIH